MPEFFGFPREISRIFNNFAIELREINRRNSVKFGAGVEHILNLSLSTVIFIVGLLGAIFGVKKPWMGGVIGLLIAPSLSHIKAPHANLFIWPSSKLQKDPTKMELSMTFNHGIQEYLQ